MRGEAEAKKIKRTMILSLSRQTQLSCMSLSNLLSSYAYRIIRTPTTAPPTSSLHASRRGLGSLTTNAHPFKYTIRRRPTKNSRPYYQREGSNLRTAHDDLQTRSISSTTNSLRNRSAPSCFIEFVQCLLSTFPCTSQFMQRAFRLMS